MTVEQMIREEAMRQGVPPDLAVAVARRESGMNPNVSDGTSGEIGMFQVKPSTAADLGIYNLRDLESNIRAGVSYLKWNYNYLGHDWANAVLGYNGGPGNVERNTVSEAARGYLAWIQAQVPGLFGGGGTSEPTETTYTASNRPDRPSGAGMELLDPDFWSGLFDGGQAGGNTLAVGDPGSDFERQTGVSPLMALGAAVGLLAVVWIAS